MGQCRTSAEQAARWHDAGIPDGYTISQMLYNPASEVVVIAVRGMKDASLCERLLLRPTLAQTYELIGNPEQDVAHRSPVTCERYPTLVFNSWRWRREPDGSRRGADWDGLYLYDLQSRKLSLCVSNDSFIRPAGYPEGGWVSEVLGLSDDACHAYVKVGLGRRADEGEKQIVKYDYHIAQLDLKTRELQLISHLKNIWF